MLAKARVLHAHHSDNVTKNLWEPELHRLGVSNVKLRLQASALHASIPVSGFECGTIQRSLLESWVANKDSEAEAQQSKTLHWARIAGWTSIGTLIATVIGIIVLK